MSTLTRASTSLATGVPAALHSYVADAGWRARGLDLAARLSGRGPRPLAHRMLPKPLTGRPRVSVIVPCFNYGHFLPASVGSALGQYGVDVEVLIVDDASTDDSAAVADTLADSDSRVTVVRNARNLGHVRAFNRGYEHATGELIVRLDADDLLTAGSLARAAAVFEAFPRVGLVYGHPRHFATPDPPAPQLGQVTWTVWSGGEWLRHRCARGVNCITTPEAVVRATVMSETGPLNPRLRFAQDMELWLRVGAVSDVAHVNGADQALHRDHDASMSVNEGAGALVDMAERRAVFEELDRFLRARGTDPVELTGLARAALAREALSYVAYEWGRGRHDPTVAAAMQSFAEETTGGEDADRWSRLSRRVNERPGSAAALHTVRRRLADELVYLRWSRTGV